MLVGSGNLGSRHLQALLKSKIAMNIRVVEPSEKSTELSMSRMSEVSFNITKKKIAFYKSISELPSTDFNLCIIATSAEPRLAIYEKLLIKHHFDFIILEKVAFQSCYEFEKAIKITPFSSRVFVNCPRRIDPLYEYVLQNINNPENLRIYVSGNNWGLASSAVHFLDLWIYLTGFKQYSSDLSGLDQKLYCSKRENYIDIFGSANFYSGNSQLSLECMIDEPEKISLDIKILDGSKEINIDQTNQKVTIKESGININYKTFPSMPISISTKYIVEEIFNHQSCQLPTLEETFQINKEFLNSLLSFCNSINNNSYTRCPIT